MNDNIKNLYNTLVSCGYNPPALDQFAKDMQDEKNLRGVYSTLKQEGYTPPSFDSFKSDMGYVAPAAQAKPAAQTSVKPVTAQVQPTATEQNQEQGKEKLTWQQQMGMQMQLDETMRQVRQSQQDFSTRMENIRKGNTLGHTSEQVFNPTTGKFERKYYTTHGDEVSTPMEQTHLNLKYRDEWESTTDEGRRHRERRIQNDFEDRIGAAIDKYDPDNAAATVWQQAEERASADMSRYLEERNKFSFSNIMRDLANASHVTGGLDDNIDTGIEAYATHLKYHDLQRMADDAWNMLGKEKQQGIIEDMYGALKTRYPQATEEQLRQAATEMAREQSDRRMFELAVEKNAPQSATDYFFRKAATSNAVHSMMMAAARTKAGTTGDMEANDVAEQRFEQDGHKVAGIAGTVAGFAIDPLTWVSAGVGGATTKGGLWLGGRAIGEAATRKFATSLGGRMALGSLGGAANFATYEAGSEALNQMKWGGKLNVDPETGRYVVGDYSAGAVAGQFGHGLMMGATTGVIAPYLGNVSDKLVRATESTAGKLAIRTGELGVGTLAEGTIFSVPDVVSTYGDYNTLINSLSDKSSPNYIADEQERAEKIEELRNRRGDAMMDVWTDNMAMIAGFKGQHLLKSAPRRIYELASSKDLLTGRKTKAGFETRLRRTLDGTAPDLALTTDEREELERGGYSDLKDLTEEYNRFNEERAELEGQRPGTTDPNRMLEAGDDAAVPYNRFAQLMNDGNISEAARAKMYYYLTGNVLPMSTVMASSVVENKDADGNVESYTVQSYGANGVVTSRTFNDKKRADVEVNRINRQVELNSVDVGERYFDWQGDNRRMYEACQAVSDETGAPVNLLFELMKNKTEDMNDVELEWSKRIIEAYEGLGDKYSSAEVRAAIDEEFGVDVDKAIRKEPGRRNEQERKAVEEYGRRLFADIKQKQEEAGQQGATPNDPTDPNTPPTTGELFFDYGVYDNGMSKAFRRGYDANEQERRDIAMELAGEDPSSVNYADRQEAWDGVMQRINNNADFLAAQQREKGRQMQHSDGSIRTATLKEKDEDGHEKQVYVVEGNVQMMPDGTMVDPEKSDNSVVIFDPATGERRMISPTADTGILSLGEVTSAEDYEAGIEQSRQRYIQEETDKAQGKVVLEPGQQIVLQTGEDAVVLAVSADGEDITVQTADGTQAQVSRSELQRIADEKALADYKQRHGITDEQQEAPAEQTAAPQPQAGESAQGAPADYAEGMELTIRDEDGTEKPAMVMGRVRYDGGQFVPDENGNIVEYLMDGEVKHDHLDKMSEKVVSHMPARTTEAEAPDAATIQAPVTNDTPKETSATAPTTPTEPQARQTEEERVIRDGIAGVGEGLRDAVSEQAAGVRENDINNWLQKPSVAEAMRKYGEGAQSVDELVQRALADNPTDETRAALNDIMRFDSSKQLLQGYISQPQQEAAQTVAMPMVGAGDNAEPDFMHTTPQRGHQYIYDEAGLSRDEANHFVANNIDAAAKALDNVKKKVPKMGTSIAKYNKDKATWQQKIADAQGALDYWNGVKAAQDKLISKEREAQHERDAAALEAAVAQAQADYEARKQAEAERKTVGNENPMPAITEKWNSATKVDGHRDEIVLPNGERVKGHYVLHESGAPSPSHNPETWAKTDGFPMDANDNSVNDRDYEQDADAQQVTRDIARQYDQRALQTPVVVSQDGVVLSGNGRTMAGELAARGNTDGAYIDYLREYAHKYGFTPEQVDAMQHPRVSFVPDEQMPYTAETFAKFNQQEMKSQNKTEHAVKLGKTVGDDIFKRIVNTINGYDTLGDFYNDADASLGAVYDLHNAGVVPQAQLAEMIDGTSGQKRLSAIGREMLENMLIGKAFAGYPEVVRMLTAVPSMRQSVITALGEIADNIALGKGWTLQEELADAVKLVYDARTDGGAQYGDIVSVYARQGVLFADPDELQTVADFNNAVMLMLADVLNDKRVTMLKQALALYNNDARDSAGGQMDLFTGDVRTREDILRGVIKFINNGKRKEIDAARSEAVERRKAASVQQGGSPASGDRESGQRRETENNQLSEENTQPRQEVVLSDPRTMSGEEKEKRGEMLRNAPAVEVPENSITSTPELSARKAAEKWWDDNVGEPAFYDTEAGEVEINRNSVESSLAHRYGQAKLDAITSLVEGFENAVYLGTMPDFTRQDGVANHYFAYPIIYKGKRGYVFCRAMQDANKNRLYVHEVFLVDNIKKGNTLQTAASQPHGGIALYRDILANVLDTNESSPTVESSVISPSQQGNVVWRTLNDATTPSAEGQGLDYERPSEAETAAKGSGMTLQTVSISAGKVTQTSATQQENGEKNTQVAVEAAEQETDTNPTDAQKEAGNYKKGHVKVAGFDLTIENPKDSERSGTDASGKKWSVTMHNTYGYIRGTEGVDGDHIDVFLADDLDAWDGGKVYVVDQYNPDGSFDEHKVMMGFNNGQDAYAAYLSNYEKGWENGRKLHVSEVSMDDFKKWIDSSHRKTKPFAEYKSVQKATEQPSGKWYGTPEEMPGYENMSRSQKRTLLHDAAEAYRKGNEEATKDNDFFGGRQNEITYEDFAKAYREEVGDYSFKHDEPFLPALYEHLKGKLDKAVETRREVRKTKAFEEYKTVPSNSTQDPMTNEQVAKKPQDTPTKYGRYQSQYDAIIGALEAKKVIPDVNGIKKQIREVNRRIDALNNGAAIAIKNDDMLRKHEVAMKDAVDKLNMLQDVLQYVEDKIAATSEEQPKRNYTVEPAQYTTKRGKVLDMQLVKFDFLQASQQKAAASLARSLKGWWDKSQKGFMLRNEEDVKTFVDAVNEESGETLADHAPLSLADLKESTPQSSSVEETNASVYNMGALPEYLQAVDEGERKLQSVDEFMEYNRWALAHTNHPEAKDVPALVKFAEGVLQRLGKKETGFFGGTVKEIAMVNDGVFSSEKKLLAPYRNNAITWLDESNKCIYDIVYEPATQKGHPDKLNVSKEYFEGKDKDNAPANEGIFEMAERIANEEEAKRKEQSEALETAVSDFVERLAADPVVVGTIKRGGKDYSALENLVHDNVQGFLTEDPNRYVENGVLKAFSKHPELFRRIEQSVRERVEEAGKESSATNNTMDTADTSKGKRNDTATPQDTASAGKVTEKAETQQGNSEKKEQSKQEEKSGPREVDVVGLFNALKQGNDVRLSDFHLDKTLDEVIATAKRTFAAQSQKALKAGVSLEQFEKALKDRDKWIDELVAKLKNGEKSGSYQGVKNADYQGTLANILGQRDALVELLDKYNSGARQQNGTKKPTKPAAETAKADTQEEQPKQEEKQAKSKWVNDEDADRFEELRKRLRQKLRGQMNMGVDPEIFAIGVEMSYLMLKKGARKFGEFAKNLVDALGEEVRPYIKAFYNGARDLPEMADYEKDMTPYEEVRKFDVMNFDKKGAKDIVATAEHITRELEVEKQAEEGKEKLVEQRNEARREAEGKMLRPATQEDIEKNPPVYYKGKRTRILMLTHRGQQTGVSRDGIPTFSKPTITSVYLADGTEVKVEDLMVEENFDPTMETQTEDVAETPKKTGAKKTTSKKKSVPSQAEQPSLFDNVNDNNNEQVHLQDGRPAAKRDARPEHRQNEPLGESQRNEAERTDGQRMGGRSSEHPVPERERGGRVSGLSESEERLTQPKNARNNHGERGAEFAPKSVDARIEANVKAIELAQQLLENGEQATPQQMAVLRKFSGWGGLGAAFTNGGYDWKQIERSKHIREMLGEEAYMQAAMSANSSFYTPAAVIDSLWDIARKIGFKGGKVLEGSAGIGNILAQMPTDMSGRSDIEAVEIDPTAGGILSLLYPDAKVQIQGFEQTKVRNNSVDLAITNVPFVTGLRVSDTTGDQDLAKKFHDIHDFCIAKNVRKLREGGLGIFITSNGTLDSSQKLRNWLVSEGNADVVGAFRLNNKTFGGTSVTSDIIVVRKRVNGQKSPNAIDVSTVSVERTSKPLEVKDSRGNIVIKELPLDYNRYFIEHPEMMAGEMFFGGEKGDTYRPASKGLYPVRGKEQERMLQDFVESLSNLSENSETPESSDATPTRYAELGESVKEGSVVVSDGQLCIAQGGMAVPLGVNSNKVKGHTKVECFETYSAIKDAVNAVLDYQTLNADDAGLKPLLQKLNKAYDDFVNTYGHLHKNTAIAFLKNDVDFPSIAALEKFNETGDKKGNRVQTFEKTDIFKQRVVEKHAEPHPTNVKDGVVVSIQQNGRIDVPYIAEQLGKVEEDVKQEIVKSGLGYENPVSGEMEVSYQYLSGNVREKLRQAQENNESGQYDPNIKALQKVMPMDIPAHLIEFTLGSSWVSPKLYEDYVKDRTGINVKLALAGGQWYMDEPYQVRNEQNKAFGVYSEQFRKDIYGHQLIEAAIQNKTIVVQETHKTYDGGKETVTDKEATAACAAKVDEIRQDFKDWARQKMQSDTELSAEMERTYNEVFNNYVPLTIPQEFIPKYFDGASHRFDLRPHQGAAAVRATMQPLMLAHEVGTGKTFTLITTAMEMRRLGTAKKPMIVVQNATVAQFVADAKALYPNAKVLTLSDKDREKEGRKDFYAKIRYNDWDMIVVPQSTLDMIPDSEERQMAYIQDKIDEKMLVLQQMKEAGTNGNDYITKQAEREIEQLKDQLSAIASGEEYTPKKKGKKGKSLKDEAKTRQNAAVKAQEMLDRKTDDTLNFEEMGIDALLVDEAHEYKHLGFATAMQRGVKGVDPSYSKKSQGVYLKCQAVLEKSHGKNVVFATGTPISNTAAEVWTFMRYLMPADTMKEYGIYYFDDFVRNFGSIQQIPEFGANGKFKEVNRFAGYNNLPELERIWLSVADTVKTEDNKELLSKIPEMEGGKAQDLYLPQTKALRSVMKYVKEELKRFEEMSGKEKKANSHIPLTMYGIAKAAAVDARLVLADAEDDPNSKTNEVVRQTLRTLKETADYKGTVAIFADSYQNKQSGFNLYEDIRKKLIEQGVPAEQVVVMKPGMKINKKQDIFDKVNRGDVRVILGSTVTLGTGVNIQERLHTLIHIDAPNRPMDYTQRNGRILRQGNLHKQWNMPVRVLRFGVEDSLDVTAYQRLKTKGAIADSIMNGKKLLENSMTNRVMEEEEDVFGDTVAQLSGSEYAMLKNQMEKEVRKLESRKKQFEADQIYIHNAEPRLRGQIKADEEMAKESQALLDKVNRQFPDGKFNSLQVGKNKFGSIDEMADFFKEHNKSIKEAQDKVRDNVGESTQTRHLTLDLDGMKFEVTTTITKGTDRKGASLFSTASRKMYYSCKELDLEDVPVSGGYLKSAVEDIVENVITGNDFAERAERMTASAERNKGELEILLKRKGGTFEDEAKLKQAKDKLDEYTEKMKEELAAKEAKYAEMDAEVETATDVQAPDEEDNDTNDTSVYRLREDAPPTKTGVGYKVFVLKDGKLYPPMVANPGGAATPVGVWLDADAAPVAGVTKTGRQQVKAGGKGTQGGSGKLAYRPGWHLGTIPYALQFNRLNPDTGMRELFPANFVWAEVEYANDVDYQEEAMSYGVNKSGKFQHSLAGLPRLPENGAYTYRTNPDPNTDPWIITGAMKVNRILKPSEVDDMVEAAGREPQERQAGAVTDRQVEALNRDIARSMQEDTDMKRKTAEQMGARLNTPINIVDDVNSITHPNAAIQARKRKAKGWYDTQTGEVTVVLPNNGSVEDVAATVAHETIGHKGLRELVGEERYDEFLDETYKHLRDDLKKGVDAAAGRAFVDDTTKNGEKAKSYEQHRRTATDELFGRMAEKPFEEFSEGERTLWQKLKAAVRKLLDKFLGSLKLPEWFELGDNELRYMLWRSKERMERGKEDPIDLARDIVKRQELGLGDDVRYMMGDAPDTFKERQKKAVEKKGVVAPGLNEANVDIVNVPKHNFTGTGKQAIEKAKVWAEQNIVGVHSTRNNDGIPYDYTIREDAVGKFLSSSSTLNSDNLGVHLAVLTKLPKVIDKSIEAEEHPDYKKVNKERSAANGVGTPDMLVHRMYGAVEIGGDIYRVKTTMQEKFGKENVPHDYNVTKIELLISGSSTSDALSNSNDRGSTERGRSTYPVAKLLHNVEKSYDSGKKLLDESEKSPSGAASKGHKSLVGVHNISEEKLKKALKLGGLANPSIAVIDSDRQSHEIYGDISLVMPSAKIDGQGTALGDAETSMFPWRTNGMTLDEISEKMKQNNAPLPITEYQRFVSEFIPRAKSLDEIRAGKGLLGKYDKKAEARREIAFEDVAKSLAPEGSKRFDTTGYERLYEAARHDDPVKFVEQEYGIKLSGGDAEALRDIVTAAKEGVTTDYFETKFDRPVKLDEFAAAIVPETADEAIVKALKEQGLSVYTYKKDNAGSRFVAMQQALADDVDGDILFRDGEETEDIWKDRSMGLQERITAAATRLAANHQENKTLRNDAMRAIGGNLSDLRKAMSLQRQFDMTTVKRVYDLARVLMNSGYLNGLSQQEVKRLLGAVKNSVGHNDIEGSIQKVMDIMVDNQLKNGENALHQLETIKGSKVDARGVEVQGQLDPAGQHTMKVFKKTRGWDRTDIEEAIADQLNRMGSSDATVADEAALEYTGLQLALEYVDNITKSKVEERELREELKQSHEDTSERDRATDAYRQYVDLVHSAISQNKIERAQAYFDLVGRLSDSLRESVANAKAFKEAEKQRVREIQHNANSDMEGRPSDEHYKPHFMAKAVNNSFVSFFFSPLVSFEQMMRLFGGKSANGEGYLYNRFMRGWTDARQKEISGVREKYAVLDAKAAEVFGGKVKTWGDLIRSAGKLPKTTVSFWNGGEMKECELGQGNLLYIYMVNKMLDGRMKLRKMGVTEQDVARLETVLDPRLIEIADWLQDEFLVNTRNEYNETHKRMFGASMAAIENYFPLKILANARADKPEDLDNPDRSDGISTSTGSIIKRRRNALALDLLNADALLVILDHVAQMEHWNAFAEFNRDLNTLRTYKRFRNQVQNMTTIYGSGKELWRTFNDVCQITTGSYRPPKAKFDTAAINFAKGVTAAKVSFRLWTAIKQLFSIAAYIPEARADYLMADMVTPVKAWNWSMENLPIFNERWNSRKSGDPRLLKSDLDWKLWRTRIMQLSTRVGMTPNAFIDAVAVSIGAHSMYKTRLAGYKRDGYSDDVAERKAKQDAEILYNLTQQSSEGAFLSPMQVDRSWISTIFSVFRNSNMSYQRQVHDALRNLKHNLSIKERARNIEYMKKQYMRDGIDEDKAEKNVKRKFRRQLWKDFLRVATFAYVTQFVWNLGSYLPYLLFGDDDDEKQKMWDDVWTHSAFGWLEGFTGGDVLSQAGGMLLNGEGNPSYLSKDMPLTSDLTAIMQKFGNGKHTEALNDIINLVVQSGIGVNPQSITDGVLAIMDACGDDPALAHEAAICVGRILQVPQSQLDKMYFDEVGLSGDEVSKYTPAQLAERYALYKVKRGRFFEPWSWNDEESIGKQTDKATTIIKERTERTIDAGVNEAYANYEEVYKGVDEQVKAARKAIKSDYTEAAKIMAEVQGDQKRFETYMTFKKLDGNLSKIAKYYLSSKSPEEATLCRQAMNDYKTGMVEVLGAKDEAERTNAMQNLSEVMQDFAQKYAPMRQPNR